MKEVIIKLHRYENKLFTISRDGRILGDAKAMTETEAHKTALALHGKVDGGWVGSEWEEYKFNYERD